MSPLELLRQSYRPIQPSVSGNHALISYQEFLPDAQLRPYIYCFWRLRSEEPLPEPYTYRVVSDGCIDIFFETKTPTNSFVMGFCRKYTEFDIGTEFDYFGIRFLPSTFTLLFEIDAKRISNQDLPLEQVLPQLASRLSSMETPVGNHSLVVSFLNDLLMDHVDRANPDIDARFYEALIAIFRRHGHIDVEQELNTGLSPRQLRRVFNYYIGTTPKAFSNVVRFQYILNAKPSSQSLKENKIYYDVGFFDQAHFIKSFKAFYGVTPAQAFR